MPKIKSYPRKDRPPRLKPGDLLEHAELYCDGICYDIDGTLREIQLQYDQEIMGAEKALICVVRDEKKEWYKYHAKKHMWFLTEKEG